MSMYVGVNVHRKRSQIAIVDEAGDVKVNHNVANGLEPILSVIGDLAVDTPLAFEAGHLYAPPALRPRQDSNLRPAA